MLPQRQNIDGIQDLQETGLAAWWCEMANGATVKEVPDSMVKGFNNDGCMSGHYGKGIQQ
jgi:hypothetical protein